VPERDDRSAALVDLAFPLHGRELPRDHRWLLAQALSEALPWLNSEALAAVHPVNVVHGAGERAWLSARSRLVLRVPRERTTALECLSGHPLQVGDSTVRLGAPHGRELLPHATLYAHFVDAESQDELRFLDAVGEQLDRLGAACHRVCGRAQQVRMPGQALQGFSLMLHGLHRRDSLCILEQGLGPHRLMGCGVFVPHKSAAAVGD
jgi:CRISPR-associated protein Cas6